MSITTVAGRPGAAVPGGSLRPLTAPENDSAASCSPLRIVQGKAKLGLDALEERRAVGRVAQHAGSDEQGGDRREVRHCAAYPARQTRVRSAAASSSRRRRSTPAPRRVTVVSRTTSRTRPAADVGQQQPGRVRAQVDDRDLHRRRLTGSPAYSSLRAERAGRPAVRMRLPSTYRGRARACAAWACRHLSARTRATPPIPRGKRRAAVERRCRTQRGEVATPATLVARGRRQRTPQLHVGRHSSASKRPTPPSLSRAATAATSAGQVAQNKVGNGRPASS